MKATIQNPKQAARHMADKETVDRLHVVTIQNGEILPIVRAEFYMGRSASASVVYCNVWACQKDLGKQTISGHGSAGGGGYHKQSAALGDALHSAGVELYGSPYDRPDKTDSEKKTKRAYINGCGSAAMESALIALARACGYRGKVKVLG